ncbi:MAG: cupin domain-containing protein [Candidatus Bathyarchaeia archaeon]
MVGVSVWPAGLETPSPHKYEAEELYMILDGKGEVFQGGGETRKITKGSVIFHPSRVRHGIVAVDETITLLWILCSEGTCPPPSKQMIQSDPSS